MPYDLTHVDPDLVPILTDIDARIMSIPAPTPPFDPTVINAQIESLDARVTKLEGTPVPIPPTNHPPVWTIVPPVTFTQGVSASFSLAPFVSDADTGDIVTLSMLLGTLPQGITLDAPNKRLVYDGIGPLSTGASITLNANDGRP